MYFKGLKTALERNGLLYYSYDVKDVSPLNIEALLKYPILCVTGSHEPVFEIVKKIGNRQFMAEINPESLNTRQSDMKSEMSDSLAERSEYFDIYFTGIELDLEGYWGKPAYWLPAWVHAEVLDDMFPPTSDELCFIGRQWRRDDFFAQDKKGIISLYNTEPKECALENLFELGKLINRFKILLNPISSITTAMTGKTFEYMACKRMCLCYLNESWMFKSKELFEDGKDIIFFKTFEEMEDKYNYYINNEAKQAQIALAGYKNVRHFHNADLRAIRLAQIVLHHANGGRYVPEFNDINRFNNTKETKLYPVACMLVNNQLHQTIPHMREYEAEAFSCCFDLFDHPIRVLEWGSGNSTLYFPKYLQNGSHWDSIEHSGSWASRGNKLLENFGIPTSKFTSFRMNWSTMKVATMVISIPFGTMCSSRCI